jgi:hypothetical protein
MTEEAKPIRVIRNVRHGGHILTDGAPDAEKDADRFSSMSLLSHVLTGAESKVVSKIDAAPEGTPFDYLFSDLAAQWPAKHLPNDNPDAVVAALKTLGAALFETQIPNPPPADDVFQEAGNSTIPPVYTYWGQFIDHDITANTDRNNAVSNVTADHIKPLEPKKVAHDLRNLRQPQLNLDSVYGDGPSFDGKPLPADAVPYDGIKFHIGSVAGTNDDGTKLGGALVVPDTDTLHDLPRAGTGATPSAKAVALIGDGRNDENLIVAQLHVAFLRFHNAVVDWVRAHQPHPQPHSGHSHEHDEHEHEHDHDHGHHDGGEEQIFRQAQQLVRWHYQWLVVNDFLKTVTYPGVVDKVLLGDHRLYAPRAAGAYMPLEFSIAAYRFGHSMVRGVYDYNRNFGRNFDVPPDGVLKNATFGLIFAFTGNGKPNPFIGKTTVLPRNWIIEWDRFVDKGDSTADHFTRKIDTNLAFPLSQMINQIDPADGTLPIPVQDILKSLAIRNLLRGYELSIPTGQAVAAKLGIKPLSQDELKQGNTQAVNDALAAGGFLDKTPLWFYVLKEAEVRANGNSLGELGSRIVVETILGQLLNDRGSFLNAPSGWSPHSGVRLANGEPIVTIKDLFKVAGVLDPNA